LVITKLDETPMKVMTISGFGGPEVFSLHEMPEPTAGEGQVVIDVKASSVNPIDLKIRAGMVPFIQQSVMKKKRVTLGTSALLKPFCTKAYRLRIM
jgi:NADPH:quinone reductase-like Zn-dependent oxidoreductase